MRDLALALGWLAALALALGCALALGRAGVAVTTVRDLLHVGASVWVLGWPWWQGLAAPVAVALTALALVALAPAGGGGRPAALRRLRRSLSDDRERWSGVVLYVFAFVVYTTVGLEARLRGASAFPAAAALAALAWGDGIGGLVGRRFGRHRLGLRWTKPKTLEGSAAVALSASAAVLVTDAYFNASPRWPVAAVAGTVAAAVEALSPRASDNLSVPLAVWILLYLWP